MPRKLVFVYSLNPLILIELCGNLHFEALMIFFLVSSIYQLLRNRFVFSALLFAFSISSKLLTLILLPFYIRRLGWRKSLQYFFWVGLFTVVLFAPLIQGLAQSNFLQSLDLYFRKFEFNASIYYLFRSIGYWWKGYNMIQSIGPLLGFISFLSIISLAILDKKDSFKSIFTPALFAFTFYLLFSTTVHPWYLSLIIVCSVFSKFRFAIVWSGLVFLTYHHYYQSAYVEWMWLVALEYVLLAGYFVYERRFLLASQS